MRRLSLLLFLLLFSLSACAPEASPREKLSEFANANCASGVIYSTEIPEGEEGYISPVMERLIFGQSDVGATYAILLNSHIDSPAECGAFLIEGNRDELIGLVKSRMNLLDPGQERSFMAIYGDILFYSTLADRERARELSDIVFGRS